MPVTDRYRPAPRIPLLGDGFSDPVAPAKFPAAIPRYFNDRAARTVGLEALSPDERAAHLARFETLRCNLPERLALRYHGHQFGTYNPALGDGRGFLYAQLLDERGRLLDLGTKGSGRTPYSRAGDGRLTLKGGVREILATEMLEALGVDTSKTFSVFETGERLARNDEPSPTRSSVLVRLSHSHVRYGTFQRLAHLRETARMQRLVEFCAEFYLPECTAIAEHTRGGLPVGLARAAARRKARTVARWALAGFVHGVLNTDNMNLTGESFDYGPWRFAPSFDPGFTAAYFDHSGLYALGRQPEAVRWNVSRLCMALEAIAPDGDFDAVLRDYDEALAAELRVAVCARLGVVPRGHDEDGALLEAVFRYLEESRASFERFFFDWHSAQRTRPREKYRGAYFDVFERALRAYEPAPHSESAGTYFGREAPCTMVIDEVERVWTHIDLRDDWGPLEEKLREVRAMGAALGLQAAP